LVENAGGKSVWSISKYYLRSIKMQTLNPYIITPLHIEQAEYPISILYVT